MDYMCFRALCCKGPPPPRPEYDIVCIGLTGSGKTSLLTQLCSESHDNIVPTTGFSIKAVPFQSAILNVKELGGAANIRKYWSRYYQGSQGVVFVLDSASSEEDLETARNELHSALQHPQLCTLPFLILANHQDKPAARSIQEVKVPRNPFQPFLCAPLASQRLICDHYAAESKYSSISHLPTGCNGQDICRDLSQEGAPVSAASLAVDSFHDITYGLGSMSFIDKLFYQEIPLAY
ncbi:ADP-ribosylation factor-like protein 15 isoform X2 [Hyla sarda]|uniref:ADP-ribosylation factor-like protein 15 isoform X2 n=1 Tax=Hyla sarda TaxID=327740 RepID=UPI0024C2B245|nr:ADP-ribosylation factor-like protein 15 isoform X2 [Hyla sarda]